MPKGSGPRAPKGAAGGGRWVTVNGRAVHVSEDRKTVAIANRDRSRTEDIYVVETANGKVHGPFTNHDDATAAKMRIKGGYDLIYAHNKREALAKARD